MWIARRAFNLRPNEQALVGLAVGLVMENLLVNFLGFVLPFELACWVGVGLVFAVGLALALTGKPPAERRSLRSLLPAILPGQWLVFLVLVALFYGIGRGMAIFDDYAHLPTVSLMATGDVPPHFSLDPAVPYGYHYFLLLVAAQVVRLGDIFPWVALDFARALSLGLAVLLAAIWVQRLTRSRLAGLLGGAAMAFSTGTRWLLLFLPPDFLDRVSRVVHMIGSGSTSGVDLVTALGSSWAMDGGGPFPFPFAFSNGILNPGVVAFNGATGLMNYVPVIVLLLTFNRWRGKFGWPGAVVSIFLVASSGLLSETGLALSLAAWVIITGVYAIKNKTLRLPRSFVVWWMVLIAGNLLSLLEGGAFTDLARNWLQNILYGQSQVSYQTIGFQVVLTPAIVSSHLGVLSLFNGYQLIVALAEVGPLLLILPLVCFWGIKAFRSGRWYEASFILAGVLSFGMLFIQYSGSTGVRNTSRLYTFVNLCLVYCVPLVWIWVQRRKQALKYVAGVLLGMTMLSGLVLFAVEMVAIPKPVESYFLNELDGRMFKYYWDKLEPGALVFDPSPSRAPTVFGRATDSSLTWFEEKPAWKQLAAAPDPVKIKAAGFDYIYLDNLYWGNLDFASRDLLNGACVKVVQEYENSMHETRRLLDIRACR